MDIVWDAMTFPVELLVQTASHLSARDLGSFRCTCRGFAELSSHLIPRNGLTILDTTQGLNELLELLKRADIANNTRKLVVHSAEWDYCQRHEWERYYLSYKNYGSNIDKVYNEYKKFIKAEGERTCPTDIERFSKVLGRLPALESITVGSLPCYPWNPLPNRQYSKLWREIGVLPLPNTSIEKIVQIILGVFQSSLHIKKMSIMGSINPTKLQVNWSSTFFESIQYLQIESLCIYDDEKRTQQFLLAFPNVVELTLAFGDIRPPTDTLLGPLYWKSLKLMELKSIQATEDDIFKLLSSHTLSLKKFHIRDSYLTRGSWMSLLTRMRNLRLLPKIEAEGKLYEPSTNTTIYLNRSRKAQLAHFLTDGTAAWPFI